MTAPDSKPTPAQIAEAILGPIDWLTEDKGCCTCPGEALHSAPTKARHCEVYLDGVPTVFCLHSSCREKIAETNVRLRKALATGVCSAPTITVHGARERYEQVMREARLQAKIASVAERLLRDYDWPYDQVQEDSPVKVENQADSWRHILAMYEPEDVVWVGDLYDSGKTKHATHFRNAQEWLKCENAPGPLICPSVFQPETFSRSKASVVKRPFLVVESDRLSLHEICCVFRWCRELMRLRAIVFTGNKSLHGWFDFPNEEILGQMKFFLPQLGCDAAMFRSAQPARLPGVLRGAVYQSLVWFGGAR